LTEDFNREMMDPAATVWPRPNHAALSSLFHGFWCLTSLPCGFCREFPA